MKINGGEQLLYAASINKLGGLVIPMEGIDNKQQIKITDNIWNRSRGRCSKNIANVLCVSFKFFFFFFGFFRKKDLSKS